MTPAVAGAVAAVGAFLTALAVGRALRHRGRATALALRGESGRLPAWRRSLARVGPGKALWPAERRHGRADRRLVSELDTVAASLRAGTSLREAITMTEPGRSGAHAASRAPVGPPRSDTVLDHVRSELARGAGLTDACRRHASAGTGRVTDRLVAGALAVASAGGGRQAQAVDAMADALREQLAIAAEVRAQASQATLSAVVLSVTPLVFTAWTASTDATVRAFLFGDPVGVVCLTVGLALDGLGAWWMTRLCRAVAQ